MQRHSKLTRRKPLQAARTNPQQSPADAAEEKIWAVLRQTPVAGLKFTRRQRLGPYVVAFACPAAKFVLEIGEEDALKAAWLGDHGYRLLTFPPAAVLGNPQLVQEAIRQAFEIRAVPRA
jgi:very-short-patch-repair endonuclease